MTGLVLDVPGVVGVEVARVLMLVPGDCVVEIIGDVFWRTSGGTGRPFGRTCCLIMVVPLLLD